MSITVTYALAGGTTESFTSDWSDADMNRLLAWAKATYPDAPVNPGDPPGVPTDRAALRRAARSWIGGMKDAIRKYEHDSNVASVPPPANIDTGPEVP